MLVHKQVEISLLLGLVQQLKVLVVLQKMMLDGKYFMVLMFKLQVELIFQEHKN